MQNTSLHCSAEHFPTHAGHRDTGTQGLQTFKFAFSLETRLGNSSRAAIVLVEAARPEGKRSPTLRRELEDSTVRQEERERLRRQPGEKKKNKMKKDKVKRTGRRTGKKKTMQQAKRMMDTNNGKEEEDDGRAHCRRAHRPTGSSS